MKKKQFCVFVFLMSLFSPYLFAGGSAEWDDQFKTDAQPQQQQQPQQQPNPAYQNPPPAVAVPPPLPASSQYSVVIRGQGQGPYEMDQLRQMVQQGTLTRETLVWKEGMAQWAAAGTIQELAALFVGLPPPLPPGL
jgi:hypothetical protein